MEATDCFLASAAWAGCEDWRLPYEKHAPSCWHCGLDCKGESHSQLGRFGSLQRTRLQETQIAGTHCLHHGRLVAKPVQTILHRRHRTVSRSDNFHESCAPWRMACPCSPGVHVLAGPPSQASCSRLHAAESQPSAISRRRRYGASMPGFVLAMPVSSWKLPQHC